MLTVKPMLMPFRWESVAKPGPGQASADQLPSPEEPGAADLRQGKSQLVGCRDEGGVTGCDLIPRSDFRSLKKGAGGILVKVKVMGSLLVHHDHFGETFVR